MLTHIDFKRLSYKQQEIEAKFSSFDSRLLKLEEEVKEFKEWHSSRFPKESPVESNSTEFHEPLTDNDPEE